MQERELTEQIFRLRFQLSTGQAEALKRLRDARKDLARVKTHLRAQELNQDGAHIATQKVEKPEEAGKQKRGSQNENGQAPETEARSQEQEQDEEGRESVMTTETQAAPAAAQENRGERTVLTGKVTSAKMEKTIVVEVQRLVQHPKYRRVVRISKKFYAHDETRQAKTGDTVRIVASRPLSKLKRWRLKEVLTRNASAE